MKRRILVEGIFTFLVFIFFIRCNGNTTSAQEAELGLSTGKVEIQYSNSYFTNSSFRKPGKYIYFLSQKTGDEIPAGYSDTIYLKAVGGTVKSGQKSAYTWEATGLPNWLVLKGDDPSYFRLTNAPGPVYPTEYTSGQISSVTINNAGAGYSGTPSITITGDGFDAEASVNGVSSGQITGITILNPGFGYSTPPTFTFSQIVGQTAPTVTVAISKSIPVTITATSDEGRKTTINTTLVVLNNLQTGNNNLNFFTSYNGTVLRGNENDGGVDDDVTGIDDINGSCYYNASTPEFQAILPKQTILANAGAIGADCFAFHVPVKDFAVSFTITSKASTQQINDCNAGTPLPPGPPGPPQPGANDILKYQCAYIIKFDDYPASPANVVAGTTATGLYLNMSETNTSFYTVAMFGNSQNNPGNQLVANVPLTYRFSYFFSPLNAIPATALTVKTNKCNPNATWTVFETDTNCRDNPIIVSTSEAWYTKPGWYFLVLKSKRSMPIPNPLVTAGYVEKAQPYTISMDIDLN